MIRSTSKAWEQRWTIVLDAIEAMTCACNQHVICQGCCLKAEIETKLKEVTDQ